MAESYGALGESAKAGMTTGSDAVSSVAAKWKRIQSDGDPLRWAAFRLAGKAFVDAGEGEDVASLEAALPADDVYFCGLRVEDRFFRVLHVGADVGVIKRSKAQMQKNAPFNVMEGATADLVTAPGQRLADLLQPYL
mmetsp:Transcript_22202/g.71564  ORF Transcript_22202/g.71564 Transcript_22202/m.71564 type:complete len:137 (-) Transcript_22202:130-540(-)